MKHKLLITAAAAIVCGALANGVSALHTPLENMTVADAISIAARLYAAENSESIANKAGTWYAKYVSYAENRGLIESNTFDSYTRPVTYAEYAAMLAGAVKDPLPINEVFRLADIPTGDAHYADILNLCRAGIITADADTGVMRAAEPVTRAEGNAAAVRAVYDAHRITASYTDRRDKEAYFLVDSFNINGWQYDNKSSIFNRTGSKTSSISDDSTETYGGMYRDFDAESSGELVLEFYGSMRTDDDGVHIAFADDERNIVFKLGAKDGHFALYGNEVTVTDIPMASITQSGSYAIILHADLDAHLMYAVINGVTSPVVSIPDVPVSRLALGTTKEGTGAISFTQVRLMKNYRVFDHFPAVDSMRGKALPEYVTSGNVTLEYKGGTYGSDKHSAKITAAAGSVNTAERHFEAVTGDGVFESYILLPGGGSGASFALLHGEDEVIRIESQNNTWVCGSTFLRDFTPNVWQSLRVDTDKENGKAVIKVCGKRVAEVPYDGRMIDGVRFAYAPADGGEMWFDDVKAYETVVHDDYPAYPQAATDDKYNIGINVCDLWRDTHSGEGWQSTLPFEDLECVLGYYEEGTEELADWEIKMMVEHGIDFQHICWYSPVDVNTEPIKMERVSGYALHDGFMNAKYSDMMTFCIMWENNYKGTNGLQNFKDYLWKYWKEYYFSDPRYTVLDNKPVMTIWSPSQLVSAFGSVDGAAEAIRFMREDIKTVRNRDGGYYDGLIILFSTQGSTPTSTYDYYKTLGADGTYGYHWGTSGYSAAHQKNCNLSSIANAKTRGLVHLPTVSVGFNAIGRNDYRYPLITPEDHLAVCEYLRDTCVPAVTAEKNTWKSKTVFISTWNEFSEGTYVAPSNPYGFAYLENVRKVFTDDKTDHTDIDIPLTDTQKDRISHMTYEKHADIRWLRYESTDVASYAWDFTNEAAKNAWSAQFGIENYKEENGFISGTGTSGDYAVYAPNLNVNVSMLPCLHIRMKTSEANASFEVFFANETIPNIVDGRTRLAASITKANEFVDYYIDMSSNEYWGTPLKTLRIDPMTRTGDFAISLIELLPNNPALEGGSMTVMKKWDFADERTADKCAFGSISSRTYTGSSLKLVSTAVDPIINFTETLNIPASTVDFVHIRLKSEVNSAIEVFFTTDVSTGWTQDKSVSMRHKQLGTFVDYYLPTHSNKEWKSNITHLRVDPLSGSGTVEIECVELIKSNIAVTIKANSEPLQFDFMPLVISTGADPSTPDGIDYVVTADPRKGFFSRLGLYYEWNRFDGELMVESDKHRVIFTVGSSTAVRDGKKVSLGYIFALHDGLPIFHVRGFCELFDFTLHVSAGGIFDIQTVSDELYEAIASRIEHQWEFEMPGLDMFTASNSTVKTENGTIDVYPTNGDPMIFSPTLDFPASQYKKLVIGVIADETTMKNNLLQVFFITHASGNWAADKCMSHSYKSTKLAEGGVYEITFDLTSVPLWESMISQIRVDPVSGYFNKAIRIDYIRFTD